jgi:hypothetical protein
VNYLDSKESLRWRERLGARASAVGFDKSFEDSQLAKLAKIFQHATQLNLNKVSFDHQRLQILTILKAYFEGKSLSTFSSLRSLVIRDPVNKKLFVDLPSTLQERKPCSFTVIFDGFLTNL